MTNEDLLENENFSARPATQVTLKKGWNKVLLKLPFNPNGTRLKKWMFTFVLTDKSGRNALEGFVYSPNKHMRAVRRSRPHAMISQIR